MKLSILATAFPFAAAAVVGKSQDKHVVNQTTCGDNTYQYNGLAGYGFVPSNATDKYGDTLGGYGSAIAIDQSSWKKTGDGSYSGILYALPDRGW